MYQQRNNKQFRVITYTPELTEIASKLKIFSTNLLASETSSLESMGLAEPEQLMVQDVMGQNQQQR